MRKSTHFMVAIIILSLLTSCSSTKYLNMTGVAYQSIRQKDEKTVDNINSSNIIVGCIIDANGAINVYVMNNTDNIMTIDRTKTFFTNSSGLSTPYYDPTLRTTTQSTTHSYEQGTSVNVGTIANAVGIGGRLGTALSGVNVSDNAGVATTNANTTVVVDQPIVSIAPHGKAFLGRIFNIEGIGLSFLEQAISSTYIDVNNSFTSQQTYASCNITISYSIDDGKTYDKIETFLYANSLLVGKVKQTGSVNTALRYIYAGKPDCLTENWYMFYFDGNMTARKSSNKEFINFK